MTRRARYPSRVTRTDAVEFDAIIDGRDALVGFTRRTVGGWENYGSDADGRRGVMRFDWDDDEPSDITLAFYIDPMPDSAPIATFGPAIAAEVDAAIAAYMKMHDPGADDLSDEPYEEEYNPDDDYDRYAD